MKALKTLTISALLAVTVAGVASAQTAVYITGSTAYRSQTEQAIKDILASGFAEGYQGTDITKPNASIYSGNLISGGSAVIIKTSWSGSIAGIQTNSGQLGVNFLSTPGVGSSTITYSGSQPDPTTDSNGDPLPPGTVGSPTPTSDTELPQINMADNLQNTSLFHGNVTINGVTKNYPALKDNKVGIVAFTWIASAGAPASLTNVTSQLARSLYTSSGGLPLSLFTGVQTDSTTTVYPIGRNYDSGTRAITLAETGLGANTPVNQWEPDDSTGNLVKAAGTPINSFKQWPAETVNGILFDQGNSGYNSGGNLSKAMGNSTPANTVAIAYVSTSDSANTIAPKGNGKLLNFNGFPYSKAAVQDGQYTFWGYEHLDYLPSLSGVPKAVATALISDITTTDASIPLNSMNVSRSGDGTVVTP